MKIRISKRNMDENLLLVNFLLCIFIVYFTIMKSSSMVSRLFTLSFFVTMIFFIHNSRSYQRTDFVIVIPCLALALINILLVSQQNINFGYLKKYIMFCCTLITIYLTGKVHIRKRTCGVFVFLGVGLSLIYILTYRSVGK